MHMVKKILKTLKGIRNIFWGDSQSRVQGPGTCYIICQGEILGKNNYREVTEAIFGSLNLFKPTIIVCKGIHSSSLL